jgi:hypothetical protein
MVGIVLRWTEERIAMTVSFEELFELRRLYKTH